MATHKSMFERKRLHIPSALARVLRNGERGLDHRVVFADGELGPWRPLSKVDAMAKAAVSALMMHLDHNESRWEQWGDEFARQIALCVNAHEPEERGPAPRLPESLACEEVDDE